MEVTMTNVWEVIRKRPFNILKSFMITCFALAALGDWALVETERG